MNQDDFRQITDGQLNLSKAILEAKNIEHLEDNDVLRNFRTAGTLQRASSLEALAGMMSRHTVAIYDMIASPEVLPLEEWTDRITKNINYLLLLKALLVESQPEDAPALPEAHLPYTSTADEQYHTPVYENTFRETYLGTSPTDIPDLPIPGYTDTTEH